jgi:hypothetical protein
MLFPAARQKNSVLPMAVREFKGRGTMSTESFPYQLSRKCLPNALRNGTVLGLLEDCLAAVRLTEGRGVEATLRLSTV